MKPKILASIGAVVLYLWREFFQASPFAFLERGREATVWPTPPAFATETEDDQMEDLRGLFGPARAR